MNRLLKALLTSAGLWLVARWRHFSLDLIKIKAAMFYLRGVRVARNAFLAFVGLIALMMLAGAGFMLFHVGLFVLLPWPVNAVVLMVLGAVYMLVSVCVIRSFSTEERWMKMFKADRYAELAGKQGKP